ncbi:hypothetical protein CWC14_06580 [Pseudoalteromonas sp. S3260]|jgi:hypothetical protein|uniref:hypothetical protein n=1 Tax=Pseudoalteromonas sp. S3260 TaxID=579534 RepID=UPI00110A25ED|nr:hypothetical protein [Pseudoalteromonas sp. S3260]TMO98431.1 hypothetical protein CWC14_06580 [Pseudoalteromonas sp. S3260]
MLFGLINDIKASIRRKELDRELERSTNKIFSDLQLDSLSRLFDGVNSKKTKEILTAFNQLYKKECTGERIIFIGSESYTLIFVKGALTKIRKVEDKFGRD